MSKIFYKFKSQREYDTLLFDGLSMSVFDCKKEILIAKKLDGNDFDFELKDNVTGDIYSSDQQMIPRNTTLIVRRIPAKAPHCASRYLAGIVQNAQPQSTTVINSIVSAPLPAFLMTKAQESAENAVQPVAPNLGTLSGETEEDRINALYRQTEEQWQVSAAQVAASQNLKGLNTRPGASTNNGVSTDGGHRSYHSSSVDPSRPPPPGYTCHRCGVKGHYIQFCPTLGNAAFDNIRVKKTTGIPKRFLESIPMGSNSANLLRIESLDAQKLEQLSGKSILVTPEGNVVIEQIHELPFQQHMKQGGHMTWTEDSLMEKARELEASKREPFGTFLKPELTCPLCYGLLRDGVHISCCGASFCDSCIRNYLSHQVSTTGSMTCPSCKRKTDLDRVTVDKPRRALVEQHLRTIMSYLRAQEKSNDRSKIHDTFAATSASILDNSSPQLRLNADELSQLRSNPTFLLNDDSLMEVRDTTQTRGFEFEQQNATILDLDQALLNYVLFGSHKDARHDDLTGITPSLKSKSRDRDLIPTKEYQISPLESLNPLDRVTLERDIYYENGRDKRRSERSRSPESRSSHRSKRYRSKSRDRAEGSGRRRW